MSLGANGGTSGTLRHAENRPMPIGQIDIPVAGPRREESSFFPPARAVQESPAGPAQDSLDGSVNRDCPTTP
jgi:hypothetical protein